MTFKLLKLYYIRLIDKPKYGLENSISLSLMESQNRERNNHVAMMMDRYIHKSVIASMSR
jgi:ferritin-like protein